LISLDKTRESEDQRIVSSGELVHKHALQENDNSKTKAIILSSQHNPTGKIFARAAEMIAESLE
jgi:aspartate/methionine/tyrosine aminotransferase